MGLAAALGACTGLPPPPPEDPHLELAGVPFHPQTDYQCGPAALATVLGWSGVAVKPADLTPQVYLPARQGSLQVELLAAARRAGRIPWVLPPEPAALQHELAAGNPVLVLQDLNPAWARRAGARRWHYAVIVGHRPESDLYVLRSGRDRRRAEPAPRFLASWAAGGNWALVVVTPGKIPATATAEGWVRALVESGPLLPPGADLGAAWASLLARWPAEPTVLFAAANRHYLAGRYGEAEARYRELVALVPGHVAGRNNLANLLLDRGCPVAALAEAEAAAATAARLAGTDAPDFGAAVQETLARIQGAMTGAGDPATCDAPL